MFIGKSQPGHSIIHKKGSILFKVIFLQDSFYSIIAIKSKKPLIELKLLMSSSE